MEEEEEKIDTTHNKTKQTRRKRGENQERIFDARSETRKEFIKFKLNDPKKLQEIPLKKAKKRRRENFKENRLKKIKIKLII